VKSEENMKGQIRSESGKMHAPSVVLGVVAACMIGAAVYFGVVSQGKMQLPNMTPPETTKVETKTTISPTKMMMLAENTIADIASDASLSVVNIDISKNVSLRSPYTILMPGFGIVQPRDGEDQPKAIQTGSGSGLIIKSDGFILTNNHVIQSADDINVTLSDKRKLKAKVIGRDTFTDLALLKIDAKGLPAAKLGTSKAIRPGDWAIAIGSPLGLDHTVTLGIVSALGRSLSEISSLNNVELIQTDAAINPGNSGGPLLNIHGEVIGINTAIRQDGQNIGFAIPVDVFRGVSEDLIKNGKVSRAYVGVYMQPMDKRLAKSLGLDETTTGVLVAGVAPNSPAQKAGLQRGDVIQKVDGTDVDTSQTVQKMVRKHKPGEVVNLLVLRGDKLEPIDVKVDDYPQEVPEEDE
jgi:serine protease Do